MPGGTVVMPMMGGHSSIMDAAQSEQRTNAAAMATCAKKSRMERRTARAHASCELDMRADSVQCTQCRSALRGIDSGAN